jgi:hypothetical protein
VGRQRATSQPKETLSPTEKAAAIEIADILAGTIVAPNPPLAISLLLLGLIPAFLPSPIRVQISGDIASVVVHQIGAPKASGAILVAHRGNLAYRALYAVTAVKRLVKAVRGPGEEGVEERLTKAFRVERSYLEGHLNASKRRTQQAEMINAAMEVYGPILSWRAVKRETSRPNHLKADGSNFDARRIPVTTGAYPGVLPNCLCSWGPPIPGAKEIG